MRLHTKLCSAPPPPLFILALFSREDAYCRGPVVQDSGVSVYFGWVRVGLLEMRFKFQLGTARMLSPTLTWLFPLDAVVQFLFYLLGIDKCRELKQFVISLEWLK